MEKENPSLPESDSRQTRQSEQAPQPASGDAFVAHAEDTQPHRPEPEPPLSESSSDSAATQEAIKRDLWAQVIVGYKEAGISRREVACRIGHSDSVLRDVEKRGVESMRMSTLTRYLERLVGWSESLSDAAARRRANSEPRPKYVPTAEDERFRARTLIMYFDSPLYDQLTREEGEKGSGGYISPEAFRERQEQYLQEHNKNMRKPESLDLVMYRDRIAAPRLRDRLVGAADEARRDLPLSPGLTRDLVANVSIVQAIQVQLDAQTEQKE